MNKNYIFTSESVTEGHPDKVCDQISDAILDEIIAKDPHARVAAETAVSTGLVLVMGEISTESYVDIPKIVRKTIIDIGYDSPEYGFDGNSCSVLTAIDEQSPDIAQGVDNPQKFPSFGGVADGTSDGVVVGDAASGVPSSKNNIEVIRENPSNPRHPCSNTSKNNIHLTPNPYPLTSTLGAGDQGMMFGYACIQTPELMPLPISLAHKLAHRLAEVRKNGTLPYLRPDGKTQVSVEYDGKTPIRVDTIVVSTQHAPEATQAEIKNDIIKEVINPIIPENLLQNTKILTNPTGAFIHGGPAADTGLTGRKIIVDTYGGYAPHGGGAFSGKDPTKVDRSGAYMARFIAKNVVAHEMADECEIQLAYAIGVPEPISIMLKTNDTEKIPLEEIEKYIRTNFDLTPKGMIETLNLLTPIYKSTAAYGHFGRDEFAWEKII